MNSAQVNSAQVNSAQAVQHKKAGLACLKAGRLVHSFAPEASGFKVEFH